MALVIRYFSTTAAGAGDGTTWADRAALFSAGVWSTVITGFAFNGSDAMEARIGPGTYTCGASLSSASFTNAPTIANFLLFHGCDSSGNRLTPPDPDWVSAQPPWDDSALPVIATTSNITTINLQYAPIRLLKFTATARINGAVVSSGGVADFAEWIVVESSSNGASSGGVGMPVLRNSVVRMTGAAYDYAVSTNALAHNVRAIGVTGTSGNRRGFSVAQAEYNSATQCVAYGFGGPGASSSSAGSTQSARILNCVFAGNGDDGIQFASTASQGRVSTVDACVITGNGAYGIDAQSAARVTVTRNRLRDNTSGDAPNGLGNYPSDLGNDTSAGTDADEFVDAANGDYRIKYGSALWGTGVGAGDGPATIVG